VFDVIVISKYRELKVKTIDESWLASKTLTKRWLSQLRVDATQSLIA
jgi:hypothetical protein